MPDIPETLGEPERQETAVPPASQADSTEALPVRVLGQPGVVFAARLVRALDQSQMEVGRSELAADSTAQEVARGPEEAWALESVAVREWSALASGAPAA